MIRRKLSPSEIVERLRVIEALMAEGQPVANALLFVGLLPAEYDQWRSEYAGLLRTLGPLADGSLMKKSRRPV
jgi:putative transposase